MGLSALKVLGIETSCDETSAAVVEDGRKILSNVVFSQEKFHKPFKGIVPEIASRSHVEKVNEVIAKALGEAKSKEQRAESSQQIAKSQELYPFVFPLTKGERKGVTSTLYAPSSKLSSDFIDAIAVTVGPGLVGSLLVGKMAAEAAGWVWDKPVIGINHLEAHLYANMLEFPELNPPFLGLIVSGGHTDLVVVEDFGRYKVIGRTRDDAAGECFDKAANILGLGYPGGPQIDQLSKKGNPAAVSFPRPYLKGSWDFSFSGLKTAILYFWQRAKSQELYPLVFPLIRQRRDLVQKRTKGERKGVDSTLYAPNSKLIADVCASFQAAVVDVLVHKTLLAAGKFNLKKIAVGGGVAANSALREKFVRGCRKKKLELYLPSKKLCTDNAAMVAAAGYFKLKKQFGVREFKSSGVQNKKEFNDSKTLPLRNFFLPTALNVDPSLPIQNWRQ